MIGCGILYRLPAAKRLIHLLLNILALILDVHACGHHISNDRQVVAKAILGGLHHEYRLEEHAV